MIDEGYIKFDLDWIEANSATAADHVDLRQWQATMRES